MEMEVELLFWKLQRQWKKAYKNASHYKSEIL